MATLYDDTYSSSEEDDELDISNADNQADMKSFDLGDATKTQKKEVQDKINRLIKTKQSRPTVVKKATTPQSTVPKITLPKVQTQPVQQTQQTQQVQRTQPTTQNSDIEQQLRNIPNDTINQLMNSRGTPNIYNFNCIPGLEGGM